MQHYDIFSLIYDYTNERMHGGHRIEALDLLELQPGATVLDVPTGTGANFPLLMDRIGPAGRIFAVDMSPGMLARARSKVEKGGWESNVELIEADARTLEAEMLGVEQVDAAICMLGLTVIPDWADVFQRVFDIVRPGGRVVVMDLYLDGKRSSGAANAFYKLVAKADSRRRVWEPLESQSDGFTFIDHKWFGGVARIAAGTKRADTVDLRDNADTVVDLSETASDATESDVTKDGATSE